MIHKILTFLIFGLVALNQTYGQTKKAFEDTSRLAKANIRSKDEVLLNVGYATILKSKNTESISVITKEDIGLTINQGLQQAIQGRVPGV
jgi:hypothetical protein